jgi:hypothetical protein
MVSGALGGAWTSFPLKFAMLLSGKWNSFLVEWEKELVIVAGKALCLNEIAEFFSTLLILGPRCVSMAGILTFVSV